MEIIIGREEGARRLHCIADGREFNVGQAGCVPASVSRKHCKIVINGSSMSIENLKPHNITFVDGNQVFCKGITASSRVQLGNERFTVPLQQILQLATGQQTVGNTGAPQQPLAPSFSLRPMEDVWNAYNQRNLDIVAEAAKSANRQKLQGILSMLGMCVGFIPGIDQTLRIVIIVGALLVAIYFFLKGSNGDTVQQQQNDLDTEFAKKYKCPNPSCGKPFGRQPYHMIKYNKQCFACGCKYTH